MTNVDLLHAFARKNDHYFEHGDGANPKAYANLFDAKSSDDPQLKLFHWTDGFRPVRNDQGLALGVHYKGGLLCLYKSTLDNVVYGQKNQPIAQGKYRLHVHPLVDRGVFMGSLASFIEGCDSRCVLTLEQDAQEIYNLLNISADGIWVNYSLYIPNDFVSIDLQP